MAKLNILMNIILDLEKFYTNTYDKLIDLNMDMNKWFFKLLDIDTKIIYSSELCELNKLFFSI